MPHPPPIEIDEDGTEVYFRGKTSGAAHFGDPDTELVVTDTQFSARPIEGRESGQAFTLDLDEIRAVRCDGVLRRTVTIETDEERYSIPTNQLDEAGFRGAIVELGDLRNSCTRLGLDRLPVCPCRVAACSGCLLLAIGVGLILSIFGFYLGVAFVALGGLLLGVLYLSRAISDWRGANVWTRNENGLGNAN